MQDSLRALLAAEEPSEEATPPFEFMGLNWWQLLIVILSGLALIYLIFKGIRRISASLKKRKAVEAESEKHYFELLHKASKTGNQTAFMKQLLFWYDHFREDKYQPELEDFLIKSNNEKLEEESRAMNVNLFGKSQGASQWSGEEFYQHLSSARQKSKQKQKKDQQTLSKLNP